MVAVLAQEQSQRTETYKNLTAIGAENRINKPPI